MKVVLTNLSNQLYKDSRFRLNESGKRFGIENINSYDFEDLKSTSFYQQNKKILDQPTGIGYWLWKPFIILETMKSLSEGDIVVYSDCGIEFIDSIQPLIQICSEQQEILLFANGNFKNKNWTKRDCFIIMNCDSKEYWNCIQCDAAFCMFKKSKESISFLNEWLHYCCDERLITDIPNVCGKRNLFGFLAHRRDQSILSILSKKYSIPLYRVPSQFGNHYKVEYLRVKGEINCVNQMKRKQLNFYSKNPYKNSPYGQLLNHHRNKSGLIEDQQSQNLFQMFAGFFNRRFRKIRHFLKINNK